MSGKEKIVAGEDSMKDFFIKKNRIYHSMDGKWTDVRKADKNRSNESKKGDTFHNKRNTVEPIIQYQYYAKKS